MQKDYSKKFKKINIPTVCNIKISLFEEAVDYSHCELIFTAIKLSSGKHFKYILTNSYS